MGHDHQDVAAVFHEGDDSLGWGFVGWRVFCTVFATLVFAADPMASDGVDHEAAHFLVFAALPAVVHAPDGGGRAVLKLQQGAGFVGHDGGDHLQLAVGLGELQGGLHVVALAHALFFIGGDAFGTLGGDVFDAVEVLDFFRTFKGCVARYTPVGIALGAEMSVATGRAQTRHFGGQLGSFGHLVLSTNGEQGFGDAVLAALMVDEAVGAKLAQGQEPGARQEALAPDVAPSGRYVGHERQAREVVARQEALAGQVAVGVEVAVEGAFAGQQQVALLAGFVVALLGFTPFALAGSGVVLFFVVQLDSVGGGAVQIAPAVNGFVKLLEGTLKDRFWPGGCVPGCAFWCEFFSEHAQHSQPTCMGSALGHRFGQVVGQVWGEWQVLGFLHVEQVADAATELFACFSQPDGLQVALHQFAVGQIECGGVDLAVNHANGVAEVILVMGRLAGAIRDDQSGLPSPACAATALCVVGRGGRHVAHVDSVEGGNVHPQLHGG